MKIGIAASVVGIVVLAANVPDIHGQQRSNGVGRPATRPGDRTGHSSEARPNTPPPSQPSNVPSPVAPVMNPIQPIIRYEGWGTPTVVIQSNVPGRTTSGAPLPVPDRRSRQPVGVIGGGGYLVPDYYGQPFLGEPYGTPAPLPGQLPGVYYPPQPAVSTAPVPAGFASRAVEPAPRVDSEPNRIITPPIPERTVEPPALGTSKADVLGRYGQPWGSMRAGAKETLYFKRGLTLVIEDGKVSEVR